ncbi:MAG: folate-binding protein [Zoogloeaceae bacterium]|jgi:folate-binding protein YgfZ|nr:folate-binding protein [Zoogloeaceae bacterium]
MTAPPENTENPLDFWRNFSPAFDTREAEFCAASAGKTVLAPLPHLAVLEISGDDALSFMQGQFTQDLRPLRAGVARYAAWCSAKGRMLANFLVAPLPCAEKRFYLILAADLVEATLKRLPMFVLRAKVRIAAVPLLVLGLAGEETAAALQMLGLNTPPPPAVAQDATPEATLTFSSDGFVVIRLPEAEPRFLLLLPPEKGAELWPRLATMAQPVRAALWQGLDVRAGFPWITAATREAFVPQMADFAPLGVSFKKGCYTGQEIVARTQHLGKVKRHLYRLASSSPLVPGEPLYSPACADQPGSIAGTVVTVAPGEDGYAALAVLLETGAGDLRQGGANGSVLTASLVNPDACV